MAIAENNLIDKSRISDFTCGKYINEHPYFLEIRSVIRFHFYFDELEVCNPLESSKSKNKLACFYLCLKEIKLESYLVQLMEVKKKITSKYITQDKFYNFDSAKN